MERKQNLFEKLNMKDYTNQLEKILEKKGFSEDSKNLLLSMFYKIENAYQDYAKTKVEVPSKSEFLNNLLSLIEQYCKKMTVVEFDSEAGKLLEQHQVKYLVSPEEGSIIAYGNESLILMCLFQLAKQEIAFPKEQQTLQYSMNELLQIGNEMNQTEVIRDFNGWSWDVNINEIEDISRNLTYQTLLYLLGKEFMQEWLQNRTELADYMTLMQENLKQQYGEKRAKAFVSLLCKIAIDNTVAKNEKQKEIFIDLKNKVNEEYRLLSNKRAYIEQKTNEKKAYTKQIEEIDKILNNKELLKEEYTNRNAKLPNQQKIFSISHLADRLEKERKELLENIKECNQCIDPVGFVNYKDEIKSKKDFLDMLDLDKMQNQEESFFQLSHIFLECFQIKIAKEQNKKELTSYFYELRYYQNLPFDAQGTTLKELPKLKNSFTKVIQVLLQKGKDLGVIDFVTEDEKANEQILSKMFESKLIDLDHLTIITKVENNQLFIEYYDGDVLETKMQFKSDKTLKLKRKTKIFL